MRINLLYEEGKREKFRSTKDMKRGCCALRINMMCAGVEEMSLARKWDREKHLHLLGKPWMHTRRWASTLEEHPK